MKYERKIYTKEKKKTSKKTSSLTNWKTDHERVGKMRNLERLNLSRRDLKVVLFGDVTIDCGREFQGWTNDCVMKPARIRHDDIENPNVDDHSKDFSLS